MGALIEFPADDLARARRFWQGLLGLRLTDRRAGEGHGLQARDELVTFLGLHERGPGPGDRGALPYFEVDDLARARKQVTELGGEVVHPGASFAICRDSEGNAFGLAQR